jgi:hypothetical protein
MPNWELVRVGSAKKNTGSRRTESDTLRLSRSGVAAQNIRLSRTTF